MCTLGSCTISIPFIFHIFIIQCLLNGLLCYHHGGLSNPPSHRQDGNGYGDDVTQHADMPPSHDSDLNPKAWNTAWNRGMPSFHRDMKTNIQKSAEYTNRPGLTSFNKRNPKAENLAKNRKDVTRDNQRDLRHYRRTAASPVGRRKKNKIPLSPFITAPTSTSKTVASHKRYLEHKRKVRGRETRKRRRQKTRWNKAMYMHPSSRLADKKQTLQVGKTYQKPSEPLVIDQQPSPYFYGNLHPTHNDVNVHSVLDEDWNELLGISNIEYPTSNERFYFKRSSKRGRYHPSHETSKEEPRLRPPEGPAKDNLPSHEMYQSDEPTSYQFEAFMEALYNIDEYQTCAALKCKHPQPSVHFIQDPLNPQFIYMPPCVILHRCTNFTGCCGSAGECVVKTEYVLKRAFLKADIVSREGNILTYHPRNAEIIELVNHTECECRRRVFQRCDKLCPDPLQLFQDGHDCRCTCEGREGKNRWDCELLQNGVNPLSTIGLVCIKEGKCYNPICIVGEFDVKSGLCPLSDLYAVAGHLFPNSKERHYSRDHLRHLNFTYQDFYASPKIPKAKLPEDVKKALHNSPVGKDKQSRTKIKVPKPRKGTHRKLNKKIEHHRKKPVVKPREKPVHHSKSHGASSIRGPVPVSPTTPVQKNNAMSPKESPSTTLHAPSSTQKPKLNSKENDDFGITHEPEILPVNSSTKTSKLKSKESDNFETTHKPETLPVSSSTERSKLKSKENDNFETTHKPETLPVSSSTEKSKLKSKKNDNFEKTHKPETLPVSSSTERSKLKSKENDNFETTHKPETLPVSSSTKTSKLKSKENDDFETTHKPETLPVSSSTETSKLKSKENDNFETTQKPETLPVSSSTKTSKLKSKDNDNSETSNEKNEHSSEAKSSQIMSDSSENLGVKRKKPNFEDRNSYRKVMKYFLEEEFYPQEGSGSDAEN